MFSSAFSQLVNVRKQIYFFLSIALLLFFAACATGQQSPQAPKPMTITAEDLKKLRWIEGSWRGTGVNQPPFFERYRFENDTTLAVDHFEDETLAKVTKTSRYELKNGEFGADSGRYVATALDDSSISFAPLTAKNSFTWKRETKDSWTAILTTLASGDKPASEVVYKLERWPKP